MKRYVIRETTGYPKIIRNGQPFEVCLGDEITEDELATLVCDRMVKVICTLDSFISTIEPGVIATPAPKSVPVIPKTEPEPTPEPAPEEPAAE